LPQQQQTALRSRPRCTPAQQLAAQQSAPAVALRSCRSKAAEGTVNARVTHGGLVACAAAGCC